MRSQRKEALSTFLLYARVFGKEKRRFLTHVSGCNAIGYSRSVPGLTTRTSMRLNV